MALKRPPPLEDRHSASSLSDEEESGDISDNEHDQKQHQPLNKANQDSKDDEEEEEDPEENKSLSIQQPQSSSDSDSDSDIHSGDAPLSPTASDFTIKPIVSKPTTVDKKSAPKPISSASKRAADSKVNGKELPKKTKLSNEARSLEEKKSAITRIWSEDDEIAILKGMTDYKIKKGSDPYADAAAFHEFIKKSIHVDVSKNQLMDKIRRLKKKYQNNSEKGQNGEDPVFSKPHDHISFELSKKLWGSNSSKKKEIKSVELKDENYDSKNSNKRAKKVVELTSCMPWPKENGKELALQDGLQDGVGQEGFWCMYPRLEESLELDKSGYLSEAAKNIMKEGMGRIGNAKAKVLEEKWKDFRVGEVELHMKRLDLIREQTKLMLDAMKSSIS